MENVLEQKKSRLMAYYEREREMLSSKGIKSYAIGSRNVAHYDTALRDIQETIKILEREVSDLEQWATGKKPRRAMAIVPRDW